MHLTADEHRRMRVAAIAHIDRELQLTPSEQKLKDKKERRRKSQAAKAARKGQR